MEKIDQHEFDEIFRVGLRAPGLSEVDEDWTLMIASLQQGRSRNKIPYYMIFVSSVVTFLLLVISVKFNSTESIPDEPGAVAKTKAKGMSEAQGSINYENITESIPGNSELIVIKKTPELIYYSFYPTNAKLEEPVQDAIKSELISNIIAIRSDTSFDAAVPGVLDQRSIDGRTQ